MDLHVMHCSMQFSDTASQKRADAKKIFARVEKGKKAWITGTEAGMGESGDLRTFLQREAKAADYRFYAMSDVWVAVRRERIAPKSWHSGWIKTLEGGTGSKTFSDRGIAWVTWDDVRLKATVSVGVAHYMTDGRKPGDEYYRANTMLTRQVGLWGKEYGAGGKLCFFGADANILDRTDDVFRGAPFTTLADELRDWENTGHGSIDVIASYDPDGRVKAKYWRVLDDREFHLYSDHFACEGGFTVADRGTR